MGADENKFRDTSERQRDNDLPGSFIHRMRCHPFIVFRRVLFPRASIYGIFSVVVGRADDPYLLRLVLHRDFL